jgi:phenylalanyl-tRNA synthetase beta chain
VPLGWLSEWIDLPVPPEELAERLTLIGLEIDEIERRGPDLSDIQVGYVVESGRHPNADRLSLCRVQLGEGEPFEVVCGAPNVTAGQKVAVALPGTVLPDGTRLKKTKIRGVVSNGMICSERELGLGSDHEGILVLDPNAPLGASLETLISAGDVTLEVAIPPNRGDCASIIGIAREARALFGGELRIPPCDPSEGSRAATDDIRIEIDDPDGCYRYVGRVVRGVRIGPSPDWICQKLEAAGMRAINVAVDVTNLLLLEFGQPLHAFDLSEVRGRVIRVRRASEGERMRTLDGVERTLVPEDLVIADGDGAVAVAGVMGGAESEVRDGTTNILIESAHFNPSRVRRTARRLGLQSESSYRFERGVDRGGIERAANRAARLLAELAGGEVSRGAVVALGQSPPITEEIRLDPPRVNRVLGTSIATAEMAGLLERIGVGCTSDGEALVCRIPTHRNDLHRAEDLMEEVARIYGYDRIPTTLPTAELRAVRVPPSHELGDRARDSLRAAGLLELVSFPFIRAADLDRMQLAAEDPRRRLVEVQNPIVDEQRFLRTLVLPTLLEIAQRNRSRQVENVRLFEVSRVFAAREDNELPEEPLHVAALLLRGETRSLWERQDGPPLFHEAKGVAQSLLEDLGRVPSFLARSTEPFLHPGAASGVAAGGRPVGYIGEIHPAVAAAFELDAPCAVLEIDLTALQTIPEQPRQLKEVSRHPLVRRDLSVLVERDCPVGELLEAIRKAGGSTLVELELFDRYEGRGVPEGKVSVAFRLIFQRPDRTLTDQEVAAHTDRVVQALSHRFGATLR